MNTFKYCNLNRRKKLVSSVCKCLESKHLKKTEECFIFVSSFSHFDLYYQEYPKKWILIQLNFAKSPFSCPYYFLPAKRPDPAKFFLRRRPPSTTWVRPWWTRSSTSSSESSSSETRPWAKARSSETSPTGPSPRCRTRRSGSISLQGSWESPMERLSNYSFGIQPDR